MESAVSALICFGRLLHHLRGAWRCTTELACIVNATITVAVDEDPGF